MKDRGKQGTMMSKVEKWEGPQELVQGRGHAENEIRGETIDGRE